MMFEFVSHVDNFLLRPVDDGFETHSDLVFRFEGRRARGRYVVPAGWNVGRKVRRRRVRAKMVREYGRLKNLCRRDLADLYAAALKAEGSHLLPWEWIGVKLVRLFS